MAKVLRFLTICIVIYLNFAKHCQCGTTRDQLQSAANLIRLACQPKFVTSDVADEVKRRNIPSDRNVKCYLNCILEMTKSMRKGKFQLEAGKKQIQILVPDDLQEEWINGLVVCKESGAGLKDQCDVSFEVFKCYMDAVPSFIIP